MKFFNGKALFTAHRLAVEEAMMRVLQSGEYVKGKEVEGFEREFANFCRTRCCIGVGNGLDALMLALHAAGIGPGCDVLVPSNTYIADWIAISTVGATIVPVEPLPDSFIVEAAQFEAAMTPNTRAILAVHLFGQPAVGAALEALAQKRGLALIEDCAQAHGALSGGRRVGSFGLLSAFSFYPTKPLGCYGDGGAVLTSEPLFDEKVRTYSNYGSSRKYYNSVIGRNSRLDEIQAAPLRAKLPTLDRTNKDRAAIAEYYREALSHCSSLQLPSPTQGHVWHQFVVRSAQRAELRKGLHQRGIETLIHYPIPPHLQEAYQDLGFARGDYPIAERQAAESLSLPIWPQMTLKQASVVVNAVRSECERFE